MLMKSNLVKVGIVGLGRWAKVLTRASLQSAELKIVAGYSRSEEKRSAFREEFGIAVTPDLASMLADREIEGVILTVPNEQHLPLAREVAKTGKHVYTEKPIASTLEDGLEIEALEKTHGVTVTVGHSTRLMAGIRRIRAAIDSGELGRDGFIEANFSNERALELTPKMWRWYKDRAPGGPLSQLAIHHFDVVHYLGGEIVEASSMASKLSPVGAELDDLYPARQGRVRQPRGIADPGERHVSRRARHVCGKLPQRKTERAHGKERQCRDRSSQRGAPLHREAWPGSAYRRRDRGGARPRRRK